MNIFRKFKVKPRYVGRACYNAMGVWYVRMYENGRHRTKEAMVKAFTRKHESWCSRATLARPNRVKYF